jgi:cytoskeleton protein RodZ
MSNKDNDPALDPDNKMPARDTVAQQTVDTGTVDAQEAAAGNATLPAGTDQTEAGSAAEPGAIAGAAADPVAATPEAAEQAAPAGEAEPESEVQPEIPGQLPGELLSARRQELRMSIEELSVRVKLAPRQLIALEANDFGSLPGMASTRGFIRSYAKALNLEPEPLLAMVAHEPNPALGAIVMRRPLPQPGFNGRRYAPSTRHRRGANKLSGLAAVVLIFVGMLAFVAWRNDWLQVPGIDWAAARDAMMPASSSQPQQEQAAVADTASEAAPVTPAAPKAVTSTASAAGSADPEAYAPTAPTPAIAAAPAAATKAAPAAASVEAARALELKLREDAWVEVLTQNGERKLVSRLMKAGSTERVDVSEPLILIVGNAAGVEVTLRGQPVNLKAGTRDNVAKVNLK